MARRKKQHEFKSFESNESKDTGAMICHSMLLSEAWLDLTPQQRNIYLVMKSMYYARFREVAKDNPTLSDLQRDDLFYFNHGRGLKYGVCGNYKKSFYDNIKALIQHGFIELVYDGKPNKRKSIYRYSSGWKEWEHGQS